MNGGFLFAERSLFEVLGSREEEMLNEADGIEGARFLNTSVEDLCDYFEQKYRLDVPQLKDEEITVAGSETNVDVSQSRLRLIVDRSEPFYIKGTEISYFIPFEGNPGLFKCQPSLSTLNPPRGVISGDELVLTYTRTDHDAGSIRSAFGRDVSEIKRYLTWVDSDVCRFNASLRAKARQRIESRREKLMADQGLVAALGFPIRKRGNSPSTCVVPSVRRKVLPRMPPASEAPFVPEPTLDMEEYEHILSVITNMVVVMERSPEAFKGMREEDLRQHFLVQLNGQYEGQATGETFNFDGKTDILIRSEGKNIFIAECKVWRGPASLDEAIGQVLDRASWRDTKTAILVFNRGRNFSDVLGKIPETVKARSNFKRELSCDSETGFRYVLSHRDDPNRELILTVLAFEVPA
jgi:hypothetical protein